MGPWADPPPGPRTDHSIGPVRSDSATKPERAITPLVRPTRIVRGTAVLPIIPDEAIRRKTPQIRSGVPATGADRRSKDLSDHPGAERVAAIDIPETSPLRNHLTRCSEVPCVNESGTAYPWVCLLKRVVTDPLRRVETGLDVSILEEVLLPLGVVRPDAGKVVGLELEHDRELVRLGLAGPALHRRNLAR